MRRSLTVSVAIAVVTAWLAPADAADSPVGTWVKKSEAGKPAMTLTIDSWGRGKAKLTYDIKIKDTSMVLTIVSALDGNDAPVLINGKPSGETMAIKVIDARHSSTVLKMNGKLFGTSKGAFSADFNTLTVESDYASAVAGNTPGKSTETWTRK
jgi:hypothetical protein